MAESVCEFISLALVRLLPAHCPCRPLNCDDPSNTEEPTPQTASHRPESNVWEFFNPQSEIDIKAGGDLPHWTQGSVWYFITFRLADALPQSAVEKMQQERERWKRSHDLENLSPEELEEYHRLFSVRYEELLHAGNGSCALREPKIATTVHNALNHFEGQRYDLDESVVMPNHVHLLVRPYPEHKLERILHSWKSYTANQINKQLNRSGQLWQHESYDHIVRNAEAMDAIRKYIRNNPKPLA